MATKTLYGRGGELYLLQSSLGEGAMGQVYLCQCSSGGQVVIKQVRVENLSQHEQAEAIHEVKVMQELSHLNIVRYIECIQQDGYLYIVMEYCRYGDLSGLIASRTRAGRHFSEQEIMFWFVQIALALWQLHSKGILHRDLKSQNIFIAEGGIVKLGDFGISRVLNSDTELVKTAIGTPYYLSPEIVLDKPYNRKSDCWALGCVLYELSSLHRAFNGGSLPALVVKILRGRYPPLPSRYGKDLRGLVDALLQQDPQARPSIDAILRMPYVKIHLARYAQHVMKLTLAPTPGISSEVLAAAEAGASNQSINSAACSRTVAQKAAAAEGASSTGSQLPSRPAAGDRMDGCMLEQQQAASRPSVHTTAEEPNADAAGMPAPASTEDIDGSAAGCVRQKGRCGSDGGDSSSAMGSPLASNTCSNAELGSSSSAHSRSTAGDGSDPEENDGQDERLAEQAGPLGNSIHPGVQQRQQQRRGVLGTGWLEQQQAAFDQLQAEVAALPARPPGPWSPHRAPAGQADQTPHGSSRSQQQPLPAALQQPMCVEQIAQQLPVPSPAAAVAAAAVTPLRGKPAASKRQPSSKKGPAGISTQPKGGGGAGNLAARRKAALSPAEAVRQERAAWRQQQAKDAAAEATRRAARAAELAAVLQEKAVQQAKQQQESASAAAAHRQHMKAVQARIPKGQLAELGAAFRQRLAAQLEAVPVSGSEAHNALVSTEGHAGAGIVDGSSNSNLKGGIVVLQESVGGQALLVALGDGDVAGVAGSAAASRPLSGRRSSSLLTGCSAGSSVSGSAAVSVSASVAASRSASRRSTPERERAGPGRLTPREKPWKADRRNSRRSTVPEVEIFCPYGTRLEDHEQQLLPLPECQQQQQRTEELTFACGLPLMLSQVQASTSVANTTQCDSPQMQHVLAQIQTALAGASSSGAASPDALDLPPEVIENPSMQSHASGEAATRQLLAQRAGMCSGGCATEATPLALRIGALRCKLEDSLGQDVMLLAYRYVEAIEQAPAASKGATDDHSVDELGAGAADPSYELLLEELLGPDRMHLMHQIHKLLLLESQAF